MGPARALIPLLAAALPSQEPEVWSRPVPIAPEWVTPFVASGGGSGSTPGRISALDVKLDAEPEAGRERLPFATPVRDFEIGRLPDGSVIVLAGGVREGLDVYRFDPSTRVLERYPTEGGRRLRSAFGGGLGSWPLAGAAGLLLFAFERDDAVQFRAVVARRVLASRALPLECEGFRARLDATSRRVEVTFVGAEDDPIGRLDFLHPVAPRLVVEGADGGRVDFGDVLAGGSVARRLVLRNEGLHELVGRLALDAGFVLAAADDELRLEPGQQVEREIRFEPIAAGEIVGRFRVESEAPSARAVVELRGTARVVSSADRPRADPGAGAARGDPSVDPGEPDAAPRAEAPRLARPDLVDLEALWMDVGRLRVAIQLAPEDAGVARLWVRVGGGEDRVSVWPVYRPGRMETVVAAQALELVEIAVGGPDGRGPWVVVGRAPAALRLEGRWVAVHAPAFSDFLLLEVVAAADGGSTRRVLRSWRGRADARGHARFDVAEFVGDGVEPVRLQLMITSFRAGTWRSGVLEI